MNFHGLVRPVVSTCLSLMLLVPAAAAQHFTDCAFGTGTSATLVLPLTAVVEVDGAPIEVGDEIAVYTSDGVCAGVETWGGENLAVAVWGDDIVTPDKDGLAVGEPFTFRVWDASADAVFGSGASPAAVTFSDELPHYTDHGRYVENGIFVLKSVYLSRRVNDSESGSAVSSEDEVPGEESVRLAPNYPNPFRSSTIITYVLGRETHVRLTVLNILGQTVLSAVDANRLSGEHEIRIDMDALPSGVYFYRIETPTRTVTRSMLLSK